MCNLYVHWELFLICFTFICYTNNFFIWKFWSWTVLKNASFSRNAFCISKLLKFWKIQVNFDILKPAKVSYFPFNLCTMLDTDKFKYSGNFSKMHRFQVGKNIWKIQVNFGILKFTKMNDFLVTTFAFAI